jgi:prepilin-type N-terminal cleavage/methylation domain-containing protein
MLPIDSRQNETSFGLVCECRLRRDYRTSASSPHDRVREQPGFTLLEVLIALTITLILMATVAELFSHVTDGIRNSRSMMDLNDQLRNAKHRLIADLRGTTAPTIPPLSPEMHLGYFEYVEGPRVAYSQIANNSVGGDIGENLSGSASNQVVNSVMGDVDDIMMFTTTSFDDKFVGRGGVKSGVNLSLKTRHAEVAWFLRRQSSVTSQRNDGRAEFYSLHRRQFLLSPNAVVWGALDYANTDLSLRTEGGNYDNRALPPNVVIGRNALDPGNRRNSLGDLTMRENRSLHQSVLWPYEMAYVSPSFAGFAIYNPAQGRGAPSELSLPTLAEQTNGNFPLPTQERVSGTGNYVPKTTFTPTPPIGYAIQGVGTRSSGFGAGSRQGTDIILTNVVSFDVKAWDPGAPVLRAPSSATNPQAGGVLVPGDGGYIRALDRFIGTPTNVALQPVAFGAFADLAYMATQSGNGDTVLARFRNYMEPLNPATLSALRRMEAGAPFSNRCRVPRAHFGCPSEGPLSKNPYAGDRTLAPSVWDTWSTHYEMDGLDNDGDGQIDEGTNGVDDNGNGLVDEPNVQVSYDASFGEQEAPPPYRWPLRGLKITIRIVDHDSKQLREVTVVHEFVPL